MPYTDIRIGWHLDLAHRDALIEAYKKRFPVPCYSPCPVNLGNSTTSLIIRQSHHTGNLVNQVPVPLPVPEPIPAPVPYPVYYPPAPAVSHMFPFPGQCPDHCPEPCPCQQHVSTEPSESAENKVNAPMGSGNEDLEVAKP